MELLIRTTFIQNGLESLLSASVRLDCNIFKDNGCQILDGYIRFLSLLKKCLLEMLHCAIVSAFLRGRKGILERFILVGL